MNGIKYVMLFVSALTSFSVAANAVQCEAKSASHKVALLELYTSEGCSSCPPADRFVSALSDSGFAADKVVPLSLHVDYWNYIGWDDVFSQAEFTDRQKFHAATNQLNTIYTPQFVVDGADARSWFSSTKKVTSNILKTNQQKPGADITLNLNNTASAVAVKASVQLQKNVAKQPAFYLALYENNLDTVIQSGENEGRTLHHDYVVRQLAGPFRLSAEQTDFTHSFKLKGGFKQENMGVAAFVQSRSDGSVLQAMSVPLCQL